MTANDIIQIIVIGYSAKIIKLKKEFSTLRLLSIRYLEINILKGTYVG